LIDIYQLTHLMELLPKELLYIISGFTDAPNINISAICRLNKHFNGLIEHLRCCNVAKYFIKHDNYLGVQMVLLGAELTRQKAIKLITHAVRRSCKLEVIAAIIHHTPIRIIYKSRLINKTLIYYERNDVLDYLHTCYNYIPRVSYLSTCVKECSYSVARRIITGPAVPHYRILKDIINDMIFKYWRADRYHVYPIIQNIRDILQLLVANNYTKGYEIQIVICIYYHGDFVELLKMILSGYHANKYINDYICWISHREECDKYIREQTCIKLLTPDFWKNG